MIEIDQLSHSYGTRRALDEVSLHIAPGEIFGLVGPNGGGKTTLLRILCTLVRPASGRIRVAGADVSGEPFAVRRHLGVVFQSPALDSSLTVKENLLVQGALYGMSRRKRCQRTAEVVVGFGLQGRESDRVGRLSGGLQRRVEIAKSLLHRPRVLVLDEPSTGLDPSARADLWGILKRNQAQEGTTVLLTTHLMDEAAQCDRVGLIDRGQLVAVGKPADLAAEVGGDVLTIESGEPEALCQGIREKFGVGAQVVDGFIRVEREAGHTFIPQLVEGFAGRIRSVSLRKPTLEDVFVRRTGRAYCAERSGLRTET